MFQARLLQVVNGSLQHVDSCESRSRQSRPQAASSVDYDSRFSGKYSWQQARDLSPNKKQLIQAHLALQ